MISLFQPDPRLRGAWARPARLVAVERNALTFAVQLFWSMRKSKKHKPRARTRAEPHAAPAAAAALGAA